jgi:hypothetical protein
MKAGHYATMVTRFLLVLMCFCVTRTVFAAEDAYLKALEAEAQNLHTADTQPQTPADASPDAKDAAKAEKAVADTAANTRKAEFETELKKQLPNTFTIYNRLAPEQKMMVVETWFANEKKMALASKQVFDFYLFDRKRASQ